MIGRRQFVAGGLAMAATASALPILAPAAQPPIERGVNIPLWFDQDDGSDQPPSRATLEWLRRTGFSSIRLPLSPTRFARGERGHIRSLGQAVNDLTREGFAVTLDLHPLGAFREALKASAEPEDLLVNAWVHLGRLAADLDPQRVSLELLNEPPMWQDRWLPLRERLAATVRARAERHTMVWGANRYQRIDETLQCPLLSDSNSKVAVHYYTPMDFTHQCQNWGGTSPGLSEADFPSNDWGVADIDADFRNLADWAQAKETQVVVNEFGTLGFCNEVESRAHWTRAVRQAAERHGFGWTYWELDRGFGFIDSRNGTPQANSLLLESLVGR
jgi:endoglucanase